MAGSFVLLMEADHLLKGTKKDCGAPKLKSSDIFLYSDQDEMDTSLAHCLDTSAYTQLSVSGPCDIFCKNSSQNTLDTSSSSVRTYMPRA